jgi:acetyltransferase-like isoleucine patch superfamily enzyme
MPVTLGRRSYMHEQHTLLNEADVQITVGHYTSIARRLTIVGGLAAHSIVFNPKLVTTFEMSEAYPGKGAPPRLTGYDEIHIGSDVWVGTDVCMIGPVTIGHGAIIGARSVLSKDVPPFAVVVGSNHRIIRYRYTPEQIRMLLLIRWWDWSQEEVISALPHFGDIEKFLLKYGP